VGNAGSRRHVKYGPRGPNVHVASRVEAATKELQVPFVATEFTVEQLSGEFAASRICRAALPGLPQPVNLYSVRPVSDDRRQDRTWRIYDEALRRFEQGRYQHAAEALETFDPTVTDVPVQFLSEQIQRELNREFRRRSTDKPATERNGVITISAK
jgi:hypothetical protein